MLSFEEKIMALASIRTLGFSKAVFVVSKVKRCPSPTMRDEMQLLDSNHYLLDDGVVEKTSAGIIQYVEFTCPQQPTLLTKEYFDACKSNKQESLLEALAVMNCVGLLKSFRPAPIVKKTRYAQTEENAN